jgi:hypothetical protein
MRVRQLTWVLVFFVFRYEPILPVMILCPSLSHHRRFWKDVRARMNGLSGNAIGKSVHVNIKMCKAISKELHVASRDAKLARRYLLVSIPHHPTGSLDVHVTMHGSSAPCAFRRRARETSKHTSRAVVKVGLPAFLPRARRGARAYASEHLTRGRQWRPTLTILSPLSRFPFTTSLLLGIMGR